MWSLGTLFLPLTIFLICRAWAARERGYWWNKDWNWREKIRSALERGWDFSSLNPERRWSERFRWRDLSRCGVKEVTFNLKRLLGSTKRGGSRLGINLDMTLMSNSMWCWLNCLLSLDLGFPFWVAVWIKSQRLIWIETCHNFKLLKFFQEN